MICWKERRYPRQGIQTVVPVLTHKEWLRGEGQHLGTFMGIRLRPFVRVKMGRRVILKCAAEAEAICPMIGERFHGPRRPQQVESYQIT